MREVRLGRRGLKVLFAVTTCSLVVAFALATEPRAYAYTDPGSGLLILQSLGSAFMGLVFICRRKIARLLHRGAPEESTPASAAAPSPERTPE